MVCSNLIPYFGMLFFTGFAISSVIVPSYSDKNGRKKVFLASLAGNLFVFITLLILPSNSKYLYLMLVLFLIDGLASAGRTSVGYCYFVELSPAKYADYLGTGWNISEGFVYIVLTIYFRYISKNWFWTIAFGTFLQAFTLFNLYLFVPESPKWLYDQKRYLECQKTLRYMARRNGVTLS